MLKRSNRQSKYQTKHLNGCFFSTRKKEVIRY
nr:MAG TPA: hypothetical protein [Caudoviricetes sp.]